MLHTCTSYSSWNLCSSIQTRRAFTRLTCSCRIWWAGRPASGCSDTRRPHPPLRSCRCRPSCPQQYRDSESCVPRRWDPYGEWWFERAGRRVGLGEGARHSCDPDNTQRKTVASSNNGCSGKKGKRKMETNENEGKKKKKNQVCETVQLLIPEVVCGYQRLIAGLIFIHLNYKHHQFLVLLLLWNHNRTHLKRLGKRKDQID